MTAPLEADETSADETSGADAGAGTEEHVVVYWRPGCLFCIALRRRLRRAGVPTHEVNIHHDPDAAAFVRRHANGNETVPTVDIAGTVLVNPAARDVIAHAKQAGIGVGTRP